MFVDKTDICRLLCHSRLLVKQFDVSYHYDINWRYVDSPPAYHLLFKLAQGRAYPLVHMHLRIAKLLQYSLILHILDRQKIFKFCKQKKLYVWSVRIYSRGRCLGGWLGIRVWGRVWLCVCNLVRIYMMATPRTMESCAILSPLGTLSFQSKQVRYVKLNKLWINDLRRTCSPAV